MRISDAKALVGKIVILDMLMGLRVTTKIKAVVEEGSSTFMHCGDLVIYVLEIVGQNPADKSMEIRLTNVIPYGIPELKPAKDNYVDVNHVVMAGLAQPAIAENYSRMTGSIVPAAAGTPLPDLAVLGDAMNKLTAKP